MNTIDDEDYYNASDAALSGRLCSEADDADADSDTESGDEDELDLSAEIVLPRCVIGRVTGVRVATEARIRRRLKTWKCSRGAVADLPTTRKKGREKEKSVVAYAKKNLVDMKNAGSFAVAEVSDLPQPMMAMFDRFVGEVPVPTLGQGWAQRPAHGTMYGAKYISRFMKEVTEMFKRGAENKSDKIGPARMVETLRLNYPKRYDIPGESEVRTAISTLYAGQRKRPAATSDGSLQPPLKKQFRMEQRYADFLKELVMNHPGMLPKAALPLFRKEYPDADTEVYTDARVKLKMTASRRHFKEAST
ncbi:hypothetical protein PR002_g20295 [Phytophthora rubi]|uniref:Uncharacterized protein n=1 Tax=Phytophthora rubi TaxID=129364 RepID=A0A6A3JDA3_9STRA|nr:hypothetical protein PR002_g20295 [Phytophthora rubi]